MSYLSDSIAENYRTGKPIQPKRGNKFTRSRQNLYEEIKNRTGENPDQELDYSLQIIKDNAPQIQRYIISQGEVPVKSITGMAKQAYQLRCNQIKATAEATGLPNSEAQILIESEESDDDTLETSSADTFLGQIFAPIGIAATHLKQQQLHPENFGQTNVAENVTGDIANIISGVTGIVGSKISSSDFRRAAQNKPAGILGALGTGGTSHYNALRSWFASNPSIAKQVSNGQITDENTLYQYVAQQNLGGAKISMPPVAPSGATAINSNDVVGAVADYQTKQQITKYLPYILIGIVAIVLIIVVVRRKS